MLVVMDVHHVGLPVLVEIVCKGFMLVEIVALNARQDVRNVIQRLGVIFAYLDIR
jgi:hypothetical protein